MGLSVMSVSGGTADIPAEVNRPTGNPNPHRFAPIRAEQVGPCAVALVHYPDCTNYEGHKILLFAYVEVYRALCARGVLDPHFTAESWSPVARFEPTERGWALAIATAKSLAESMSAGRRR